MKKENIPKLKAEVLKMLPTPQSNIWKTLNLSAKQCSKLVGIMMKENLVGRTIVGGKFIVERYDSNKHNGQNSSLIKSKTKRANDISELPTRLSKILPALQSDIWKKLGIERRHCSKLMMDLTEKGFIKRTKVKGGTYMVEKIDVHNIKHVKQKSFSALLSDSGRFSPCTGCVIDCNPKSCNLINDWLLDIKAV